MNNVCFLKMKKKKRINNVHVKVGTINGQRSIFHELTLFHDHFNIINKFAKHNKNTF